MSFGLFKTFHTLLYGILLLYFRIELSNTELIRCNNNTSPCISPTLQCTENTPCEIICESADICANKQLICNNNHTCDIYCNSPRSCKSSTIDGQFSSQLNVVSNTTNALKDSTIKCPSKLNDAFNTKRCHLTNSNEYKMDVHESLTIYAQNSWNDIDIDSYNGIAKGNMFCDIGQCEMTYGLWNCINPTDPCYIKYDKIVNKICGTKNSCQNRIIHCNDTTIGGDVQECNVICVGDFSCQGSTINCNQANKCNIICTGQLACHGVTQINCPAGMEPSSSGIDTYCTVLCGTEIHSGSCYDALINGNDKNLKIYAMGLHAMSQATINCGTGKECIIICQFYFGCQEINIHALYSNDMQLICDIDSQHSSCNNPTIYCPPSMSDGRKNCLFYGTGNEMHSDFNLYCINSWDDIQLNISNQIIEHGIMHCTESFNRLCIIRNNSECLCPALPTSSPTEKPLFFNTTVVSPDSNELDTAAIILLIAFGSALVLILCGWVYWYCMCRPSDDIYDTSISSDNVGKYGSNESNLRTIDERQRLNTETFTL